MTRNASRNLQRQAITQAVQTALAEPKICQFREMLVAYFQQEQPVESLARRPQIGFRLPHGEYIFSVRPKWFAWKKEIDSEIVLVEALRVQLDDDGQRTTRRKKVL